MSDRSIIDGLNARRKAMDQEYRHMEGLWQEIRDWQVPTAGRFSATERRNSGAINTKVLDSQARQSRKVLRSGLIAGMSSPSREWFRLKTPMDELNDVHEVAVWLDAISKRMSSVLAGSNIYRTLARSYDHLGGFGTACSLVVHDFDGVIHSHYLPIGSYRLGLGLKEEVTTVHRDVMMTVGQMVEWFGPDRVPNDVLSCYRDNNLHERRLVQQAIEPRYDRDPIKFDNGNMRVSSVYWMNGHDKLLEVSGFRRSPILAPRWETENPDEPYALSFPGSDALGAALQLQQMHKDRAIAIQKSYNPPLMGGPSLNAYAIRNIPGGVTTMSSGDLQGQGVRPIYEVKPDIQGLQILIEEQRQAIREAYYEDLFLMLTNMDRAGVTATEILERHEEKVLMLGPVLDSVTHELLGPLIEITFDQMQDAGLIPPPPDAVVEAGAVIEVEYISVLAQAQKALGVPTIERSVAFVASMEQVQPGVIDMLDGDVAVREFVERVGAPPSLLRSPEAVDAIRQRRAQQQQMEQAVAAAGPMAQAASVVQDMAQRSDQRLRESGL